jgi:hypothetical protein
MTPRKNEDGRYIDEESDTPISFIVFVIIAIFAMVLIIPAAAVGMMWDKAIEFVNKLKVKKT